MASIGMTLRIERERQRLTIANIANELRITQQYLAAIEDDHIQELPGAFFYKSFVRQYASYLGLDVSEFQEALAAAGESIETTRQDEQGAEASPAAPANIAPVSSRVNGAEQVLIFFREAADRIFSPGPGQRSASGGLAAILILATAGVAGWVEWPQLAPSKATALTPAESNPQVPNTVAEQRDVPPAPEPDVASSDATIAEASTISTSPVSADKTNPLDSRETAPVLTHASGPSLKLTATELTWLSVSDQGKLIFSGVLQAGEIKTFPGLSNTTLRLGNAGGIVAEWNGQPTGSLGHHGDVRTVRFNTEGFRILEPGGQL